MLKDSIRAIEHETGLVLMHLDRGLVLTSNHIGTRIWRGLADRQSCGQIADQLSRDYVVTREQAMQDVTRFVHDLRRHGLAAEVRL